MEVNIKVKLNGSALGSSAIIPELKYNKSKGWFCFEFDDGSVSAKHTLAKMQNSTYTDGCGNNKPYTAGIALNARFGFDNAEIGLQTDEARGSINYSDQLNFINQGWDLMNHSYYHEINSSQTGVPVWGYGNDPQRNINELDALILSKHNYKMNAMVVPTDYAGFMNAAKAIGYIGGCSQGTFDDNPIIDQYQWPQRISQLANLSYQAIKREFAIQGWGSTDTAPWLRIDDMVSSGDKGLIDVGTHTMSNDEENNFRNWLQSIKDRLGDSILFTSLREFLEYQHLRFNVVKTETIFGNELHIKLDYTNVPNQSISWHDLSLVVNTSATLNSIEVDNQLFSKSFSNTNKLVNINYRKTDFSDTPSPSTFPIYNNFRIV